MSEKRKRRENVMKKVIYLMLLFVFTGIVTILIGCAKENPTSINIVELSDNHTNPTADWMRMTQLYNTGLAFKDLRSDYGEAKELQLPDGLSYKDSIVGQYNWPEFGSKTDIKYSPSSFSTVFSWLRMYLVVPDRYYLPMEAAYTKDGTFIMLIGDWFRKIYIVKNNTIDTIQYPRCTPDNLSWLSPYGVRINGNIVVVDLQYPVHGVHYGGAMMTFDVISKVRKVVYWKYPYEYYY